MSSGQDEIRFLVFDIESVADPLLIAKIRHAGEEIDPLHALRLYRDELMKEKGTDFIPYTYQVPISLALAKIRGDFSLADVKVLGAEDGGPGRVCQKFWAGWLHYKRPTLVTFNGRGFDLPLLELTAYRYSIPVPEWFAYGAKAYDQPRNRFNCNQHLDLCDYLTNTGAAHFHAGLNIASKLAKKPGKVDTKGDMVQDLFLAGQLRQIHEYCRFDVLDTYFVFLRTMLICGKISAAREAELVDETHAWMIERCDEDPSWEPYLTAWDELETATSLDDYLAPWLSLEPAGQGLPGEWTSDASVPGDDDESMPEQEA
ncbi:MAG: 3'-5' exonuclease [Planctomycetia bacterium]|nr:3'-5' exonuclease [Planctomycetia bacterium]